MPRTSSKMTMAKAKSGNEKGGALTHERLQADLEAFRKAGGRVEVLGNTRVLKKVDGQENAA
ncbi:hypothetical protein SAMN05428989_1085 [Pseudoxanthomonas sp. GM95]|uniref:hypothetical protein n=1 Tax=Pseudoxanthomonas sp. GM95 TaxID=1881043 RepID=UPI0008B55BFD|nr:hypothetical protein [Pseudoxanthomonas sp. GM95]SEK92806.1 hypothetical protein SAMN05428989_1085 [Pseudoxanthomonas sp. GM95]